MEREKQEEEEREKAREERRLQREQVRKREERKHPFVDGAKGIWRRRMIYPFTAS